MHARAKNQWKSIGKLQSMSTVHPTHRLHDLPIFRSGTPCKFQVHCERSNEKVHHYLLSTSSLRGGYLRRIPVFWRLELSHCYCLWHPFPIRSYCHGHKQFVHRFQNCQASWDIGGIKKSEQDILYFAPACYLPPDTKASILIIRFDVPWDPDRDHSSLYQHCNDGIDG